MSLTVVASFNDLGEAEVACAALRSAGIEAVVLDQQQAWVTPILAAGFRVGVPRTDLGEAETILRDIGAHTTAPELEPEDAIAPPSYERGWVIPFLLFVAGLAALWGVRELIWLRVEDEASTRAFLPGAHYWIALAGVTLAAGLYMAAAWRRYRSVRPVFALWLAGWAAAMSTDVIMVLRTALMSAADPLAWGTWTAWDYFSVYFAGQTAIAVLGVILWAVERREGRAVG